MNKNFALIGAAGYIAPRHMKAIKDTGNNLVAAVDPHDSVGIIDKYFFDTRYFKEFERFDRHLEKLKRKGENDRVHFVSICSPNYLHDAHARFALRIGAHAICEKPLVINPWNIEPLQELEEEYGKKIFTVLQLRVHPVIVALKKKLAQEKSTGKKPDIVLTYITSRGAWYLSSWKGQEEHSGGLATNIGIHFFDMLMWLFGPAEFSEVHIADERKTAGYLELQNARVKWFLSIDRNDLPSPKKPEAPPTYRSITIDDKELEFSDGFTELHTVLYREIVAGRGFGVEDAKASIQLAYDIRNAKPVGINENSHDRAKKHNGLF
ncbi:MAG: Gfo/Idh/MocA family oxidoreductase [Chitinivibrionales bacterium]|nr:Gfo/Idh/MocA family oxidoreductase [Chitinivibrionales bacterium]